MSKQNDREYQFCHTADWHLDYFQYQKKERWQDFFQAANNCVDLMIKEKPAFIIHCGDLFHHFKPTPGALRLAVNILKKLKEKNIPFYVIRGNHDASKAQAQRFGGTLLKLLEDLGYLIYIQDETIEINDDITFTGIGEYGRLTGEKIEEVIRNQELKTEKYNILGLHGYVQGQVSDSQFDVTGYQLASIGYNYIALGHYHKYWEDKGNNLYCPGSTEQTSLNDWREPEEDGFFRKSGFYCVKIKLDSKTDEWKTKVNYKLFNVRPKGRFKLDFGDNMLIKEILAKADSFIKNHDLEGAIIRFDFTGRLPLGKQSLVNLSNLPSANKMKALHHIITQNFTSKYAEKASPGLTDKEALYELLEKEYGFKKKNLDKWNNLANETANVLGQKTISSEEAEEVQVIYDLITKISSQLPEINEKQKTQKVKKTETIKKESEKITKSEKETPSENGNNSSEEKKNTKQSELSHYFKEGN
ncbi:MAG TPA: DNA repair exonuclease [candidate division Zixibacteria bacterium]|nr:DNA repair exonuclease [candidate division Zixibacteria bacterium]